MVIQKLVAFNCKLGDNRLIVDDMEKIMNFKVNNNRVAYGTSLKGYITATFDELVETFGSPGIGDEFKIDAEWVVEFDDGTIATIYNWKDGRNYLGDEGSPVEDITDWHIGGTSQRAVDLVESVLENQPEELVK
jgi:hypothetical protein